MSLLKNTNLVLNGKNTPPLASYTNLVTNGDFSDTNNWATVFSTHAVNGGVLSNMGDGGAITASELQNTIIPIIAGNKIFVKGRIRVTNSVGPLLRCYLRGSTTQGTIQYALNQSGASENQWYPFSIVLTIPSDAAGFIQIRFTHSYATAEIENGKVMEVDGNYGVVAVNLSTLFGNGNEPNATWCDTNLPFVVTTGTALAPIDKLLDLTRYSNNGTFTNTVWEQLTSGLWAMNFEAAENLVTIPAHKSINDMPQFTFSAWVYYTGAGGLGVGRIFDKTGSGTSGKFLYLNNEFGRLDFFHYFSTTVGTWYITNSSLTAGNWYHIQISYDNTSTTNDPVICVNGVSKSIIEISTPVGSAVSDVSNGLLLGNRSDAERYLNGKIAMPKMWNVIRTEAQALAEYTATKHWFNL